MPSFQDSIFIFVLALLLFGPKKLPELARYLGKLMNEFRRASAEFRVQMDDEFRAIEQVEQQKKIAALEAAAPVAPLDIPEPEHPHLPAPMVAADTTEVVPPEHRIDARREVVAVEPGAIASSGELQMKPPATGLPMSRSPRSNALNGLFDAIPQVADPVATVEPEQQPAAEETGVQTHA